MRSLRRLAFAVLPVLVLGVAVELALRGAGWPDKDPKREFGHSDVYWVSGSSLTKEPFPHKEMNTTFRVLTDSNGLRAPLHAPEKPPGTFRVMTLGCSTTFGWGVEDDESWPARMEAALAAEGHPAEVINAGQPGYTSFQGLWLWDRVLHKYSPDLVIFAYVVQDSRKLPYSDRSQAILQENADFLKQNLLYQLKSYVAVRQLIDRWRIEKKDKAEGSAAEVYRVPPDEYAENIRSFADRARKVGAQFMLFGFPLEREGYTAEHRSILRSAAEVLEVPHYDPQTEIERMSSSRVLYFPQDRGHANADGNDVIGRGVARFLITHELVP